MYHFEIITFGIKGKSKVFLFYIHKVNDSLTRRKDRNTLMGKKSGTSATNLRGVSTKRRHNMNFSWYEMTKRKLSVRDSV